MTATDPYRPLKLLSEASDISIPNTLESLRRDLTDIRLESGSTVMVHSSLKKVGWTVGGPVTVIRALLEVLGPEGTLVMPAESLFVSDPSGWDDERVSPDWHETIRAHLPAQQKGSNRIYLEENQN